jgi:RIO kinase 1
MTTDLTKVLPESFIEDWLITEVLHVVKSGKEATVYCCRAHPHTGQTLLAAKVYRDRRNRGFKNDAIYQEGRVILNERVNRAFQNKTRFGREFQFQSWKGHEYEVLTRLHRAGADVPRPFANDGDALLIEYFGEQKLPAAPLGTLSLDRDEAHRLFAQWVRNLEIMLVNNVVHGDLSPYNILYTDGRLVIIDFPQAVDPRFNRNALSLFERDVTNVCEYFARQGVRSEPDRLARDLWRRFADHADQRGSSFNASLKDGLLELCPPEYLH